MIITITIRVIYIALQLEDRLTEDASQTATSLFPGVYGQTGTDMFSVGDETAIVPYLRLSGQPVPYLQYGDKAPSLVIRYFW